MRSVAGAVGLVCWPAWHCGQIGCIGRIRVSSRIFVAFVMRGAVSHWYASHNVYLRVIHYGLHADGVAHAFSTWSLRRQCVFCSFICNFSAVRTASSVFGVADEVSVLRPHSNAYFYTHTHTHTLRKETRACRYAPTGFEVAVWLIVYATITEFCHPSCI